MTNENFKRLVEKHIGSTSEDRNIGTYKEKALHRILKDLVTEDTLCHEITVGKYVADVIIDNVISEIQTSTFYPLQKKIDYYLESTEYELRIIHPVIYEKTLLRIDKETGELVRKRRSPKKGSVIDTLPELFYLKEHFGNARLKIILVFINTEERRYSERRRYCKEGAYDSELVPISLVQTIEISDKESIKPYLPISKSFSTKEFSAFSGLSGKRLGLALAFLTHVGLLTKEKVGRKYIYTKND